MIGSKEDPDADDPLFRSIDADDFDQDFTALRTKSPGACGGTPAPECEARRRLFGGGRAVWRAVPTVVNAGITLPYQYDGRLETLEDQALSAMQAHSEVANDPNDKILARFQQHLFSSKGVRRLARSLAAGAPPEDPDPPLTELERQGKATFGQFCASCHGGPTHAFCRYPSGASWMAPQAFVNIFVQTPRPPVPFFFSTCFGGSRARGAGTSTAPGK